MKFLASSMAVAQCVAELLSRSDIDWQSITITRVPRSEAFCVSTATGMSLEDTVESVAQICYDVLTNISSRNTLGG